MLIGFYCKQRIRLGVASHLQQASSWPADVDTVATDAASTSVAFTVDASPDRAMPSAATVATTPEQTKAASLTAQAPPPANDTSNWEVPDSDPEDILVLPTSVGLPTVSPAAQRHTAAIRSTSNPLASVRGDTMTQPPASSSTGALLVSASRGLASPNVAKHPTPSSSPLRTAAPQASPTSPSPSSSDSWLSSISTGKIPRFLDLPSDIRQMLLDSESESPEPRSADGASVAPSPTPPSPCSPFRPFVKARTPQSGSETEPSTPLSLLQPRNGRRTADGTSSPLLIAESLTGHEDSNPFTTPYPADPARRAGERERKGGRATGRTVVIPFTTALRLADDPPSPSPGDDGVRTSLSSLTGTKRLREGMGGQRETRRVKLVDVAGGRAVAHAHGLD
ncbi:hypothetical protein FA95DRAFT_1577503 [Auriscalpium vulgare]|uniref:Uncharacterized protein n=1 Tax=Auriscalpium vulgare TaxID=40419 RepID=A0ACB8R6S7_9AGAM|nr:hypothetical protein FA95DRAFT_1577503 [Auriscalpium vulgare]